jgi:acyl-coenzyme A synthetase/AMP-(fatty) acid ligase
VLAPGVDRADVDETALVQWCGERLPDYGVPRRIRFLDEIPVKETLKSDV